MKAPQTIERRAQGEWRIPEGVTKGIDHPILRPQTQRVQADRAITPHVGGLPPGEVDALPCGCGCSSRSERQLGPPAQELLNRLLPDPLGGRTEGSEIFGTADSSDFEADFPEAPPIKRRMSRHKPHQVHKLPATDRRRDGWRDPRGHPDPQCYVVADDEIVEELRNSGKHE